MATKNETTVNELKINYLSESDYSTALSNGEINENEIYMTPISNPGITVSSSGSGNAVTAISASGNTLTVTKGSTFLTAHPSVNKSSDSTSTASPNHGGTFTAVDSVTRDTYGHVTKINTKTITLPADNNTDTKVTQTATSSNASYPLLLAPSGQTATTTTTSYFDSGVTLNPSTNTIVANVSGSSGSCTGNSATATKLATARTIALSGGVTGTATSFNGTANITIPVTAVDAAKLTIASSDTLILDGSI